MTKIELPVLLNTSVCCSPVPLLPRLDDAQASHVAVLLKALADPTRLQILDVLAQQTSDVCVCDLEGVVGLPDDNGNRPKQPTISHHLRVLREAGLVGYEKRGQWAYYFVQSERLHEVRGLLGILGG